MRWLTFLFPLLLLAACGENRPPSLAESRELIVLTREGPTTYEIDDSGAPAGFEHDLVQLFADEIDMPVRFVVVKHDADIAKQLKKGKAHLGAAWLFLLSDSTDLRDFDLLILHSYQQR